MMEVVCGDNWSYKTCKASVKLSPSTNQHPVFFTGRMSSVSPTNSVEALKGNFAAVLSVLVM